MRVIWAVSFMRLRWTDLQYKLLIASVITWKKYNPGTTTVLYASSRLVSFLKRAKCLELWDEVVVDSSSYLSGNYRDFTWDYPKVEALYREGQKVLYIDYDIVFHEKLDIDPNKQYCLFEESTNEPCYYGPNQKIPILPRLDKLMVRTSKALNTGILYLDYETIVEWRKLYSAVVPSLSAVEDLGRFALTIGQACLYSITQARKSKIDYIGWEQGEKFTHFIGGAKYEQNTVTYLEYEDVVEKLCPSSKELVQALKTRTIV